MTLDQLEAVLKPFADFVDVFGHNLGGVPKKGEEMYRKSYTVQGVEKEAVLTVDDFFALEAAYNFVKGLPRPVIEQAEVGDRVDGEIRKATPEDLAADDPHYGKGANLPAAAEPNPAGT